MAMERGLGRGLGALLGDAALQTQEGGSLSLPISQVEPGLKQPRKRFDEESLQDLADSIRTHGVIQPLTVRRLSSGYYQIIAGERRWRAAKLAGLTEVPAVIIEADDRKVMELGLIENLQREDLNPIEEANGYKVLMEEYGLTQEEVAQRVGKSRPAVANALRLLALPDAVQLCWRRASCPPATPGPSWPCPPGSCRRSWPRRWWRRSCPSARPRPWPSAWPPEEEEPPAPSRRRTPSRSTGTPRPRSSPPAWAGRSPSSRGPRRARWSWSTTTTRT